MGVLKPELIVVEVMLAAWSPKPVITRSPAVGVILPGWKVVALAIEPLWLSNTADVLKVPPKA